MSLFLLLLFIGYTLWGW